MNTTTPKTACCIVHLPSNATAQQAPLNAAISYATPAQQPPLEPASLLELARNRLRNSHATSSQKDTQQAHSYNDDLDMSITASWQWQVVFTDGSVRIAAFTPPASWPEVVEFFPNAVSGHPLPEPKNEKEKS